MSNSLSFVLEGKPTPASRPRLARTGHAFYPKSHAQAAARIKQMLKTVSPFPSDQPVALWMKFVMPAYKTSSHPVHRSDVDNLSKLPMDEMTKAEAPDGSNRFWVDDDLVVHLSALKRFQREGEEPHTHILIKRIEGSVEDYVDHIFTVAENHNP